MTESIFGGVIAALIVLAAAWAARRLLRFLRDVWHWASSRVNGIWVNAVNDAVKPLRNDLREDMGDIRRTIKRLDGVVSSLQMRVDEQLDRGEGAATDTSRESACDALPSNAEEEADSREQTEPSNG